MFWLLCAVAALKLSEIHYGSKLSPIGIFSAIWFTVFALFSLNLYPFNDISTTTWGYFLGGVVLFYLGNLLVLLPFRSARKRHNIEKVISPKNLKKASIVTFLIGMLGFAILLIRVATTYGLSAFLHEPEKIHSDVAIQFIGYLYLFNGISPVLAFMYLKKFKGEKILLSTIIALSLFSLLLSVSRTNMLRAFVMIYLSMVFAGLIKVKLRNIAVLGIVSVSFFVGYHYYKNPYLADSLEKNKAFEPTELIVLAPSYGYIVAPFTVFQKRADSLKEYEWGTNTFNTLARFARLFNPDIKVRKLGQDTEYTCNPVCTNVYTYLDVYYRDFGAIGIFLLTFLQGILVAIPYSLMRWGNRPDLFLVNAVIGWCLAITFFSNHFAKNSTIFFLIVSYMIGKYIYARKKQPVLAVAPS